MKQRGDGLCLQVYDVPVFESAQAQEAYETMLMTNDLPDSVIEEAIVPRTKEEYDRLMTAFNGHDRQGPGNNKHHDAEGLHEAGRNGPREEREQTSGEQRHVQ